MNAKWFVRLFFIVLIMAMVLMFSEPFFIMFSHDSNENTMVSNEFNNCLQQLEESKIKLMEINFDNNNNNKGFNNNNQKVNEKVGIIVPFTSKGVKDSENMAM